MNKKILAAAIAASIAAPMAAAADVVVFGKVRQSVDAIDVTSADKVTTVVDEWQINDRTSRLGFKGTEDLGNGMKALFHMEFGIPVSTTGPVSRNAAITGDRNAFVGLSGDFGTVIVGRHDAPHSMAWSYADMFADTVADFDGGEASAGGNNTVEWFRADGTVAYVTPNFNGLSAAIAIVPDETATSANGDGIADHVSAMVKYSNGGLTVAGGYWSHEVSDMDEWNLSAQYKMDAFAVSGIYYVEEEGAGADDTTWQISASYTMGNNVLKAMYRDMEEESAAATDNEAQGWAIGLDHNLSKRTQVQVIYADNDADANSTMYDGDVFSIGMNHSF